MLLDHSVLNVADLPWCLLSTDHAEGVDCKLMLTDFNSARLNASKTQLTGIGTEAFMSVSASVESVPPHILCFVVRLLCFLTRTGSL